MRCVFSALMAYAVSRFRSHESLHLENMALRHQLVVYHHTIKRPKLRIMSGRLHEGRWDTGP
jgi:hypothetical protein